MQTPKEDNKVGSFVFPDGARLPPLAFGKQVVELSLDACQKLCHNLFSIGQPGWILSGGSLIAARPSQCHLYLCTLYVGACLAYADIVLNVNAAEMNQLRNGIYNAIQRLSPPAEEFVHPQLHLHLMKVVDSFFQFIKFDLEEQATAARQSVRPKKSKATEFLYKLLQSAYWGDQFSGKFLAELPGEDGQIDIYTNTVDNAPMRLIVRLKEKLNIRVDRN